jgi:hypothetical protein
MARHDFLAVAHPVNISTGGAHLLKSAAAPH